VSSILSWNSTVLKKLWCTVFTQLLRVIVRFHFKLSNFPSECKKLAKNVLKWNCAVRLWTDSLTRTHTRTQTRTYTRTHSHIHTRSHAQRVPVVLLNARKVVFTLSNNRRHEIMKNVRNFQIFLIIGIEDEKCSKTVDQNIDDVHNF